MTYLIPGESGFQPFLTLHSTVSPTTPFPFPVFLLEHTLSLLPSHQLESHEEFRDPVSGTAWYVMFGPFPDDLAGKGLHADATLDWNQGCQGGETLHGLISTSIIGLR